MSDYYIVNQKRLLKEFDKVVNRIKEVFIHRYGNDLSDGYIQEARSEYEALIPKMPYIGGKQPLTSNSQAIRGRSGLG